MGWRAYRVTRPNGAVRTVLFPEIDKPIILPNDDYTIADLINISGFPVEAHIFVYSQSVALFAREYGFRNTIIAKDYAGEYWTLDNGSKIYFEDHQNDTVPHMTIRFYGADGEELYGGFSVNSPTTRDEEIIYHHVALTWAYVIYHQSYYTGYENKTGTYAGTTPGLNLYYNMSYPGGIIRTYNDTIPLVDRPDMLIYEKFFGGAYSLQSNDPYTPGSSGGNNGGNDSFSGVGGGTGAFDGTGDNISTPNLPTLSATNAGFMTLYKPSLSELNNLASYMWSDLFDVDGWKKIFADPMSAVLGLSIVPVDIPSAGSRDVSVGNISTGVSMTVAASQYVTVDCGTINVNEFWGAYLDYDPYTKAEIYLPYIGTHALSTDDIMNKSVHVVYHVDILSGACCAYISCDDTVLYSFVGQCASSLPITGDNWTNVINGALSIAGAIGSMVATGGASAPMGLGQIASTAVNTLKPNVEKSGSLGGTGGMLGIQTPYLILTRPRQAVPANQNEFIGYPSYVTELLGDLVGYTEIESIHLENIPATEHELTEIENLLKSGVIF